MTREPAWVAELLDFWFDALDPERWFDASAEIDADIRDRFLALWEARRGNSAEAFLALPDMALAAVILFDQLPRNMFRGDARAYSTDDLALAVAEQAVARGYDEALPLERRKFLLMPFMHSEERETQQRSVQLFEALGDEGSLRYARLHRNLVERFGRFPHRNEALGREPTEEERAHGQQRPF
ncbi:MAG: DUF924 family protein [Sphingomonadaceae bacterium]